MPRPAGAQTRRTALSVIAITGLAAFFFVVRLPSLGWNVHLYTAFGDYVNSFGRLPSSGTRIGITAVEAHYADFPGLSLRIYQLLALAGETPNKYVWALYLLTPLVIASGAFVVWGQRTGLSQRVALLVGLNGVILGAITARGFEDKTYFFWLPALIFLTLGRFPLSSAGAVGAFTGWTGVTPLAPFLILLDRAKHKVRRFAFAIFIALLVAVSGGSHTLTLLSNRLERESTGTFWFGFWRFLPWVDNSPFRGLVALAISILALTAFRQGWVNLPGAFTVMAITTIASTASFGHVRYVMLMPFVVYLIRRPALQLWYLLLLTLWGLVPLLDFLRYGSYFADDQMSSLQLSLVVAYTNLPLLMVLVAFASNIPWKVRLVRRAPGIHGGGK